MEDSKKMAKKEHDELANDDEWMIGGIGPELENASNQPPMNGPSTVTISPALVKRLSNVTIGHLVFKL